MKIENNMPDNFFDWLQNCPVNWHLDKQDNNSLNYTFVVPSEQEQEQDE